MTESFACCAEFSTRMFYALAFNVFYPKNSVQFVAGHVATQK